MTNIALVPIDNRPVCYQLPQFIANLDKTNKIYLPDKSILGTDKKNADTKKILEWIKSLNNIDVIILSLDTIAYGGLVSSRRSCDDFYEIKSGIEILEQILNKKNAKVYAFSSIMRISNNNYNDEEKEYWNLYGKKIFEYSYNIHKLEKTLKSSNLADKYNAGNIPKEILKDYLETRKRNFNINKYYIELKKRGIFDTLIFSKDDCAEFGLNVKEAEELEQLSKGIDGICIKTGADEIPLSLLSRALNKDKRIKISTLYTSPDTIDKISKYEDIPVKESVESQIDMAGGILSDDKDSDLVLVINNFKSEQGELVMDVYEKGFEGELQLPQKPYFIADILNANGADNNFVKKLYDKDFIPYFYGYAGWNTTGNTLGSTIAAALTYFSAEEKNQNSFLTLQTIRFLDDWAYQANVRDKLRNNKENIFNDSIKKEMEVYERIIMEKFDIKDMKTEYKFPWNRFFEIEINPIY